MVFPWASNSSFTALAELTDETELVPSIMIAGEGDEGGVCMPDAAVPTQAAVVVVARVC